MPLLDEVLDFQVQFGLIGVDGRIRWEDRIYDPDNQQFIITPGELRDQLRLIRLYIVKQYGKKDNSYYYPANFINTANHTITLCQCPAGVGVVNCNNQDIKEVNTELNNPELLHYRWRTIILDIPLRELP
jgi:hypothetical protein